MGATTPFQLWSILLNPSRDRRMINVQSPLQHHLFEVAIAERIPQIPAHTQQNDLGLKMTPFERTRMAHAGNSSAVLEYSRVYQSTGMFATEPLQKRLDFCAQLAPSGRHDSYLFFVLCGPLDSSGGTYDPNTEAP
jgi:hypothetical protein